MKFEIIYADPCWDYKGQTQHAGANKSNTGGASNHYQTLTLKQLKTLDVPSITSKDCLLFMWTSSPHLDQAIDLMKHWNFKWSTIGFVWNKQKVNPSFYTMSQIEICLIGKHGKIPQPRGARNIRQYISEERTVHSAKPKEVRTRIQKMFPTQSKIELFAREKVNGWSSWGNEIESDIDLGFTYQK